MKLSEVISEEQMRSLEEARRVAGHISAAEEGEPEDDDNEGPIDEEGEIDEVIEAQAKEVVETLRKMFADIVMLHHSWHKIHWKAFGHSFYTFHKWADKVLGQLHGFIDQFAEQLMQMDAEPPFDPVEQSKLSDLTVVEGETMAAMFAEVQSFTELMMENTMMAAKEAEGADDLRTMDLHIELSRALAKQNWFLKATLKKGDGFHH